MIEFFSRKKKKNATPAAKLSHIMDASRFQCSSASTPYRLQVPDASVSHGSRPIQVLLEHLLSGHDDISEDYSF